MQIFQALEEETAVLVVEVHFKTMSHSLELQVKETVVEEVF
jgi:hypothetical protein